MILKKQMSSDKLAEKTVRFLVQSSFKLWNDKKFRELVNFNNISKTEQDRIFNELEVSTLGLFALTCDNFIDKIKGTDRQLKFLGLQEAGTEFFIGWFKELGVEEKHLKTWKKLIKLRFKEYRNKFLTASKEAGFWKEFSGDKKELKDVWARVETIVICCWMHIRRGKVKKEDLLWKMLRKWFIKIQIEITKKIKKHFL